MEVQMNKNNKYQNIHVNRKYKDSLFRMVFKQKEDLLDLYNAINNTNYCNVEDLEVNTLENVIYISMKNDISFMIGCTMNLFEHQSTKNQNMPLRGLLYFAKLYETYIAENGIDIYNSKQQKLPTPQYIVFYNGEENEQDECILKLSDAFIKEGGCLECQARLLNINYGRNKELMEKCRRLEEYAIFVARVRSCTTMTDLTLKQAIVMAMEECIEEGVLVDILTKERDEVFGVLLSTFNKELYEKNLKEDAFKDGRKEGETYILVKQVCTKLSKGYSEEKIAEQLEMEISQIREICELASEYAPEYDVVDITGKLMKKKKEL